MDNEERKEHLPPRVNPLEIMAEESPRPGWFARSKAALFAMLEERFPALFQKARSYRRKIKVRVRYLDSVIRPLLIEIRTIYRRRVQAVAHFFRFPLKLIRRFWRSIRPFFIALWHGLTFPFRMVWRAIAWVPWWIELPLLFILLVPVPVFVGSSYIVDAYESLDGDTPKEKIEFIAKEYGKFDLNIGGMAYEKPAHLKLADIRVDDRKNRTLGMGEFRFRMSNLAMDLDMAKARKMKPEVSISHTAKRGGSIKGKARTDLTHLLHPGYLAERWNTLLGYLPDDKESALMELYGILKGAELAFQIDSYRLADIAWIGYLDKLPLQANLSGDGALKIKKGGPEKTEGNVRLNLSGIKLNLPIIESYPEVQANIMVKKTMKILELKEINCTVKFGGGWLASRNCVSKTNFGNIHIKFSSKIRTLLDKKSLYLTATIWEPKGRLYTYLLLDQRYKMEGWKFVFPIKISEAKNGNMNVKLLPPLKHK